MNISESLEQFFGLKILNFFEEDLGSGIFLTLESGSGMENSDPGSGINIPDTQHCSAISKLEVVWDIIYATFMQCLIKTWHNHIKRFVGKWISGPQNVLENRVRVCFDPLNTLQYKHHKLIRYSTAKLRNYEDVRGCRLHGSKYNIGLSSDRNKFNGITQQVSNVFGCGTVTF
jgi:hypothetical protein